MEKLFFGILIYLKINLKQKKKHKIKQTKQKNMHDNRYEFFLPFEKNIP